MGNYLSGPRELQPTEGPPLEMPADLAPELARYWLLIVELAPAGIVASHDAQVVLQLCQAMHVRDQAYQRVLSGGIEVADSAHGDEPRRNPAIITWRQAADMCTSLMNLLGLSPVSRSRLQGGDDGKADPFLEFLRKRNGPES